MLFRSDEKAAAIKNFLTGLLQQMECEAEVKVFEKETHQYKVYLEGEKLGQLIGRRGRSQAPLHAREDRRQGREEGRKASGEEARCEGSCSRG